MARLRLLAQARPEMLADLLRALAPEAGAMLDNLAAHWDQCSASLAYLLSQESQESQKTPDSLENPG